MDLFDDSRLRRGTHKSQGFPAPKLKVGYVKIGDLQPVSRYVRNGAR